jgi:hypothetical protein
MTELLIETGGCYGIEINVEKSKMLRISRLPSPIQIMIDQKQIQNVEYFSYYGSMITNDARCTQEIKYMIAMAEAIQSTP